MRAQVAFCFVAFLSGRVVSFIPLLKAPRKLARKLSLSLGLELGDLSRQIYCNVELNGANLEAVGFDMDYTLAQYNEDFDLLAFNGAKEKLFRNLGYPKEVLDFKYSSTAYRRGLVIDKSRGNILKLDRHKYVRQAYHGFRELTSPERKETYGQQVASFTESNYVNIDTLFLLVDAILFANLVHLKDTQPDTINNKSYEQLYRDVRTCVDLCHRDGVIKDAVIKDPSKYILYDERLVPMLQRLRAGGKKVFLMTNSMWDYTTTVMDYLVHAGGEHKDLKWQDLFDVAIVGAAKPAFLTTDYLTIFRVNEKGLLFNIEDRDSLNNEDELRQKGHVFQGGVWKDLHSMLGITSGDRVLYVGDHIFADILRSKRNLGWRTCLIIPELEHELQIAKEESRLAYDIKGLRQLQYDLDEFIDQLRQRSSLGSDLTEQLSTAEIKAEELKERIKQLNTEYDSKFNPTWGQLFKAGHQDSRFAKQVGDYACLYTSRASNLARVSPNRPFRPVLDFLPHDQIMWDNENSNPNANKHYEEQP